MGSERISQHSRVYPRDGRDSQPYRGPSADVPRVPRPRRRKLGSLRIEAPPGVPITSNNDYHYRRTKDRQILAPLTREPIRQVQQSGKGSLFGGTSSDSLLRARRRFR